MFFKIRKDDMFIFLSFVAGGEKLWISAVKAVLEEDGTEIDNKYLEFLDPNNAVILHEQQENWTDKDNCEVPVSEVRGKLVMHSLSEYQFPLFLGFAFMRENSTKSLTC